MPTFRISPYTAITVALLGLTSLPRALPRVSAADWPMWRRDAGRTAESPEALPEELHEQWTHDLPTPAPAYRAERLRFDEGPEPVVANGRVFVSSSRNDSVIALGLADGNELWRIHVGGPVRFAPLASDGKLWFGSDDGYLRCVDAANGATIWKFRAAPSRRKVLGNGRLISCWPVRGGPVFADGKIFFAAGVWPFEGVFVYCLEAKSGKRVWRNDRSGFIYGQQPHNGQGFGGLTPQGYLLIDGDDLVVPCGNAYPARFDVKTGELKDFALPRRSRLPGGWFAAVDRDAGRDLRRGRVQYDSNVNRATHEDNPRKGLGAAGLRTTVTLAGQKVSFARPFPGVEEEVHSVIVASGRVLVSTRQGRLHCFAAKKRLPERHERKIARRKPRDDENGELAERLLRACGARDGYAVVDGLVDGRLVEELVLRSRMHVLAFDPNPALIKTLRRRLDHAGLYGERVSALIGKAAELDLPPYFTTLLTSESHRAREITTPAADTDAPSLERRLHMLRPFGGTACLPLKTTPGSDWGARLAALRSTLSQTGTRASVRDELLVISRVGALPGTTNYLGGFKKSEDTLVRAPFGVLWFDDTLGHFKRSPQPVFVDGVMISRPKEWSHEKRKRTAKGGYKLLPPVYSDIYTGRILRDEETRSVAAKITENAELLDGPQPSQYRPETQKNAWKPKPPRPGRRTNPLTLRDEVRAFPKSYGCDGGVDYGFVFTMRSATAAVYDKRIESGTFHISGPRSGCTNSVIPAGGLLNVPFFYEGCTCSYPLPVGLALVHREPTHEQWTSWGPGAPSDVRRVGINLGAPGDRVSPGRTLWLDWPSVGGPSPDVDVKVEPAEPRLFYHHALRVRGGRGWPWVAASGAEGVRKVRVSGLRAGSYRVRLYFCEPRQQAPGARVFDVLVGTTMVRSALDVTRTARGALRSHVEECETELPGGILEVRLAPRVGETLLSGIEILDRELPPGSVPNLPQRDTTQLTAPQGSFPAER